MSDIKTRFDIFSELRKEIEDFDFGGKYIVGKPKNNLRSRDFYVQAAKGGYYYSQRQTLEAIDLACASKYRKGWLDEKGHRKTYINIVNFYRDVAKMKYNIDVSNYIFEPTSRAYTWLVYMTTKMFKRWARKESYDDQIDEYVHDFATYGTTVARRIPKCTRRVPLRTIRITQTAKSIDEAARNGGYFIIEQVYHYNELKAYPGWDLTGLAKNRSYNVLERYALVPKGWIEDDLWKKQSFYDGQDQEMVLAMAILIPEAVSEKDAYSTGHVAYAQAIDEIPFEEAHTEQRDGRWLGVGEVEKQLENQLARNLSANLRRRGLLWATKKIYQSTDDEVQKNLVAEVEDGDVLKVKPNGQLTQVNTQSQQLGDITADETMWKENSQQISFAFAAATGESMPSGTPFRLGLVLSQEVSSHFKLGRATLSNFLRRSFFDPIVPIFAEEYSDEHEIRFAIAEDGIDKLKEAMIVFHMNRRIVRDILARRRPDPAKIRADIEDEIARDPYLFVRMPKDAYKDLQDYMELNLVDDISAEVASLTSVWQDLSRKGDPRAETVLEQIFAKQGRYLPAIMGNAAPAAAAPGAPPAASGAPLQPKQPLGIQPGAESPVEA